MAKFRVTKTWDHNLGLSVAFRQHPAVETHCRFVHGYPLAITAVFESDTLDHRNWVISFGELKPVKAYLEDLLDHKTLVAADDPHLGWFLRGEELGTMQVKIVQKVGCEAIAELVYENVIRLLGDKMKANNVTLVSIEVREHAGNSATFFGEAPLEFKRASPSIDPYFGIPHDPFKITDWSGTPLKQPRSIISTTMGSVKTDDNMVAYNNALTEGGNKIRDIPTLTFKAADIKNN